MQHMRGVDDAASTWSCSRARPPRSSSRARWSPPAPPALPAGPRSPSWSRRRSSRCGCGRCWSAAGAARRSCPALFDTASDLAGLRDLDAVLRAIVHRARTLLGADVAYMTLNDEDARRHLHAGHRRLDLGPVPGAAAADGRRARRPGRADRHARTSTADYPEDARFRHTGDIDAGVGEEGLVAILGVPLRLGSRVIGVLYAANRSARPFAREEVSLLVLARRARRRRASTPPACSARPRRRWTSCRRPTA